MGLFDIFGRKPKQASVASADTHWRDVCYRIHGTLLGLVQQHPTAYADPFLRIVLQTDWNVYIVGGEPRKDRVLSDGDATLVFLREDPEAFRQWVQVLQDAAKTGGRGLDQMMIDSATQTFAWSLAEKLKQRVVAD